MISAFKKIWDFAGSEQKNIKRSIVLALLNSVFYALQFAAVYVVIRALTSADRSKINALYAVGIMVLSIVGRIVLNTYSQLQRVHAGYFMVANKRISIGNKLRSVPMGYFNKNNLGQMTAITTTTLTDVENTAPVVLVTVLGGFINSVVFALSVLLFDRRIGIIVFIGMAAFIRTTSLQEKHSRKAAPERQRAQEKLVEKVLESVQGISVIKSFHLGEKAGSAVNGAIEDSCNKNLAIEKQMTPYQIFRQIVLDLFAVVIMIVTVVLYRNGTMELANAVMMFVAAFMVFEQMKSAGISIATLRIAESSIDKANETDNVPVMDEGGRDIVPQTHDTAFENVTFSYGSRKILDGVSFAVKQKTTTAIVGPSGSGKTTMCSLIARFWDVNGGRITIGGADVRDFTLDSLMKNISMVFQNVYLFSDTVENNIKFGRPNATREQVVEAAKKACCHDFIMQLPNGYDTVLEEGGASLSGGERQRLSIARAILKNSPIIILDEATANVDPENEDRLQAAIEVLMKDKTIIMIAHRLKTVRKADRILVLDGGHIVQSGTHAELAAQDGIYSRFITQRQQAESWHITGQNT
ncbi:ABC transporter ATP-binding protein [uncultured Ruminococcus sp.]|uniref:ABC transporter ATP-binding protein n=1 Tax=uncultured Ruminococcus sp. TaxID=165186 RepID=UPI0025F72684|nr:ABC transporter ATP-binding protein [uncultured Ruminococcus sp.]